MNDYYPPVAFQFELRLTGSDEVHASFQEVSGLSVEREDVPLSEGGENRFVHRLPGAVKHQNLVCKRGVIGSADNVLGQWLRETLEGDLSKQIKVKDLTLSLVDESGAPVMNWQITGAWPVKWEISSFDASTDALAVETLEFAFQDVTRAN